MRSNAEKAAWVAGFFDGEGSVTLRSHTSDKKHVSYCLNASNTDPDLIRTYRAYLTDLGIANRAWRPTHRPPHKPIVTVAVARAESIRRFLEMIPLCADVKRQKIERILAWIDRGPYAIWNDRKESRSEERRVGKECRL